MEDFATRDEAPQLEGPIGHAQIEVRVAQIACEIGVFIDLELAAECTAVCLLTDKLTRPLGPTTHPSIEALLDAARYGVECARLDAESRLMRASAKRAPRTQFSRNSPEALISEGFQLEPEQALTRLVTFNQLPLRERRAVYDVFIRKIPIDIVVGSQGESELWRDRESFKRSLLAGLAALYGEVERS